MNPWTPTFCVTCAYFDAWQAASGDGTALCPNYEVRRRWDHPATVLYRRDPHVGTRKSLIEQLKQNHPQQGGNT